MCGIAGLWNFDWASDSIEREALGMMRALRHRGPDGQGLATGDHWALAQTRLAIVDVEGGAQPIWNEDGKIVVIGNNEIYNAPELRRELERQGHRFSTRSDTEVILHAYEQWGTDGFAKFNGMFAFAIVDTRRNEAFLARDPLGIKPLHYWTQGRRVAFASEVKALRSLPGVARSPDRDAMHLFLNLRYIPDDRTLFENVRRLPPGSFARLTDEGLRLESYYSLAAFPVGNIGRQEAAEKLKALLPAAVERHLLSDVEVGAYLSGGIDSSLVSVLASKKLPSLKTFCFGFGDSTDENPAARRLAESIGASHRDFYLTETAIDRFAQALWHVEEPKVNCLQGFLLAEQVSKEVKVVLSGLGGDELFAGYVNNDLLVPTVWSSRVRNAAGSHSLSGIQSLLPGPGTDHSMRALELGLNVFDPLSYYLILRNGFDHNPHLMKSVYKDPPAHWHGMTYDALAPFYRRENPDTLNELLLLEMRTKLVNDFLLTEDRVSMAHSLEVRVPLLDRELVEFAVSLPSSLKHRPLRKKRLLKRVARDWLPASTLTAPKWGFSFTPHTFYGRGLKQFLEGTLTRDSVEKQGLFSWPWVERLLSTPPSPRLRWHHFTLWTMAGMTLWHRMFFEDASETAV